MPSTITDRLSGLTTSVAVKGPCRVASVAPVTLSGLQTIDGIAVNAGDRVLVKEQASAVQNGIYTAATGTWRRSEDFNGTFDVVGGTKIFVLEGSAHGVSEFLVDGYGAKIIGTNAITFSYYSGVAVLPITTAQRLDDATEGQTVWTLGFTPTIDPIFFLNGARLIPPDDYTVIDGTLTLTTPATAGDTLVIVPNETALELGFTHAATYISRTVGDRLSKTVYVTDDDFLATPDGPYVTSALQRAIDHGASKVILPALKVGQNYRIEGYLQARSQVEITGQNRWATGIVSDALDEPIFYADGIQHTTFRDLRLAYNGTPLAGADAILLEDTFACQALGIWCNNTWNGIRFEGGGNAHVLDYRSFAYRAAGIMASNALDVNLVGFRMSANDSINGQNGGIYLVGGTEAFVAMAGDITLGQHGLVTAGIGASTTRGLSPWHNKIIGVYFDSARFQGAYLRQATDLEFTNTWIASSGHDEAVGFGSAEDYSGLDVSACQHIRFNGGELYNNGGRGALVYSDSRYISFRDALVTRNQYTRGADGAGIEFLNGATDFSVMGCIGERHADTVTYRQSELVRVSPAASDRYTIADNLLGGCTISDSGTGVNKRVANNY